MTARVKAVSIEYLPNDLYPEITQINVKLRDGREFAVAQAHAHHDGIKATELAGMFHVLARKLVEPA